MNDVDLQRTLSEGRGGDDEEMWAQRAWFDGRSGAPSARAAPAGRARQAAAVIELARALETPAPTTPEAAAERILALHEIALGVAQTLDAQLMECCWVIVDRGGDVEALAERLPLTADEVRGRAATWAAARRNRDLRGLAMAKPREAMALVSGLSAAGVDAADAGDLAELVALPPRRRAARVRELAAAEAAAKAGRNPDDVARIEELEEAAAAPRLRSAPVSQALARLDEAEAALDDATETLHHRIAGGVPLPPQTRARLLRKGDAVAALVDALLDALRGEGET